MDCVWISFKVKLVQCGSSRKLDDKEETFPKFPGVISCRQSSSYIENHFHIPTPSTLISIAFSEFTPQNLHAKLVIQ